MGARLRVALAAAHLLHRFHVLLHADPHACRHVLVRQRDPPLLDDGQLARVLHLPARFRTNRKRSEPRQARLRGRIPVHGRCPRKTRETRRGGARGRARSRRARGERANASYARSIRDSRRRTRARGHDARARARARPATTLARNLSVKAPGERKRVPESGGHLPQRHRVQLPLRALLRQRRLVHRDPRPVLKVRAHGLEPREVAAVEERADVPEDVVAQREEPRRALVLRAVPREEVLPPRERAALHRARGDVFGRLRVRRRRARRRVAQGSVTQHVARGGRPCEKN